MAAAINSEFLELLKAAEEVYGNQDLVAQALGITASRYSRVRKGDQHGLSVQNCLKLSKMVKAPPKQVLEAAGKADMARLLEELYHPGDASPEEVRAAQIFHGLTPHGRVVVIGLIQELEELRRTAQPEESRSESDFEPALEANTKSARGRRQRLRVARSASSRPEGERNRRVLK